MNYTKKIEESNLNFLYFIIPVLKRLKEILSIKEIWHALINILSILCISVIFKEATYNCNL